MNIETTLKTPAVLRKIIALPSDHGSWVFILSPLLIGLFAGGRFTAATAFLIVTAMAVFLIRQPVTIAAKAYSGRRPRRDLPAARFWILVYALLGLVGFGGLALAGFAYLAILALPGVPVFVWHLYLVSRRAERRQAGIEIAGAGVLALAAPAAYWVGVGKLDPSGWWLFGVSWLQSAASIVYAYLRLEQRELKAVPDILTRLRMGFRPLLYTTFNFVAVLFLSWSGSLPPLLPVAFLPQWLESIWGTFRPAIGLKPIVIGTRQTIVSALFTLLFILAWLR